MEDGTSNLTGLFGKKRKNKIIITKVSQRNGGAS